MVQPKLRRREKKGFKYLPLLLLTTLAGTILYYVSTYDSKAAQELFSYSQKALSLSNTSSSAGTQRPTVAFAVSFIKCGDFQTDAAGLIDASLVMRHSIHKISARNPESGSVYDYKMYAIVHKQAEECSQQIGDMGFEVVLVDPPVLEQDIKGEWLRKNIHKEWCCGHDEFVKLFAYKLPEELVVHVDIDFLFFKPIDHLLDAIYFDKDSPEGKAARAKLELERPNEPLPDEIGAFITRDWPQVAPGKWPPAYQAGFLIARRDPKIMDEMVEVVKEGNYTDGWGYGYGWGNKGYGGVVGSMAMQGLVAYYYDIINPGNAVELNQCRHNHMGMDVLYRHPPNYAARLNKYGKCRNGLEECEDCMETDLDKVYSVHYTMCRKPWSCVSLGKDGGRRPLIDTYQVNLDHCHALHRRWHEMRASLENDLFELTKDESVKKGAQGTYKPSLFQGHCADENEYIGLTLENTFKRVQELYE